MHTDVRPQRVMDENLKSGYKFSLSATIYGRLHTVLKTAEANFQNGGFVAKILAESVFSSLFDAKKTCDQSSVRSRGKNGQEEQENGKQEGNVCMDLLIQRENYNIRLGIVSVQY